MSRNLQISYFWSLIQWAVFSSPHLQSESLSLSLTNYTLYQNMQVSAIWCPRLKLLQCINLYIVWFAHKINKKLIFDVYFWISVDQFFFMIPMEFWKPKTWLGISSLNEAKLRVTTRLTTLWMERSNCSSDTILLKSQWDAIRVGCFIVFAMAFEPGNYLLLSVCLFIFLLWLLCLPEI